MSRIADNSFRNCSLTIYSSAQAAGISRVAMVARQIERLSPSRKQTQDAPETPGLIDRVEEDPERWDGLS